MNSKGALRFFKKLLKGLQYIPRVIVTDILKSYVSAKKKILKQVEHRSHKRLNNRIEEAHQPTRLREKWRCKFKFPPQANKFLLTFWGIRNHFKVGLYKLQAQEKRNKSVEAFSICHEVVVYPFLTKTPKI